MKKKKLEAKLTKTKKKLTKTKAELTEVKARLVKSGSVNKSTKPAPKARTRTAAKTPVSGRKNTGGASGK